MANIQNKVEPAVPERIEEFVAEDRKRTPWSARVMNQIIRLLNRTANIKGANGITIKKSDYNIVIGYDPNQKDVVPNTPEGNPQNPDGGGGGTVNNYCVCRYT